MLPLLTNEAVNTFSHFIKLYTIQRVISCSVRLIFKAPKSAHITPLLYDLHWLPISSLIQYKIALIYFHIVSGTAPPYLSELLHHYSPSRSLRSAADTRIVKTILSGHRTLPVSVRHSTSLSSSSLFHVLSQFTFFSLLCIRCTCCYTLNTTGNAPWDSLKHF